MILLRQWKVIVNLRYLKWNHDYFNTLRWIIYSNKKYSNTSRILFNFFFFITTVLYFRLSVQVESSDFYVNWKSFVDIEELGVGKHHTGISHYEVIIGMFSISNYIFYPQNWQHSQFNGTTNWTVFHFFIQGRRREEMMLWTSRMLVWWTMPTSALWPCILVTNTMLQSQVVIQRDSLT